MLTKDEFITKWIEALRSGEYRQGEGYLSMDGAFCCLGVACDLYHKLGCGPVEIVCNGKTTYNGADQDLPIEIQSFMGLNSSLGDFKRIEDEEDIYSSLADMNDIAIPFTKIATLIESKPEGLFTNEQENIPQEMGGSTT